eukprot:UN27489
MTLNHQNGVTRNPHNTSYSVGGSSGGSAAGISGRLFPLSVCEDTGGSTRHPSHNCGIFGYDPFRNKYPNNGNSPITYYNDQLGLHA